MEPDAFTTITFNSTEASNRNTIKEEWSWDLSENRRAGSLWANKPLTKECPHFRVKLEVPAPYICIGKSFCKILNRSTTNDMMVILMLLPM